MKRVDSINIERLLNVPYMRRTFRQLSIHTLESDFRIVSSSMKLIYCGGYKTETSIISPFYIKHYSSHYLRAVFYFGDLHVESRNLTHFNFETPHHDTYSRCCYRQLIVYIFHNYNINSYFREKRGWTQDFLLGDISVEKN